MQNREELTLLVGIGYEKCGTTSLASTLAADQRFCVYPDKEAFYFSADAPGPFSDYMTEFLASAQSKYLVDFTPEYVRSRKALQRIFDAPLPKKVIVCVREPLSRAYSHYLHGIYYHHAHYDVSIDRYRSTLPYERPYIKSFEDELKAANSTIRAKYYDGIEQAYSLFGKNNTLILVLEKHFRPEVLSYRLSQFLGTEIVVSQVTRDNEGSRLPLVIATENDVEIGSDQRRATLLRDNLYIFLSEAHGIACWQGLPREAIERAVAAAARWTGYISAQEAERLREEYFGDVADRVETLVGEDLPEWRSARALSGRRWLGAGAVKFEAVGTSAGAAIFGYRPVAARNSSSTRDVPPITGAATAPAELDYAMPIDLRGFVEVANRRRVSGWAIDRALPNHPLSVRIEVNGRIIAAGVADHYRADLERGGQGNGRHGFNIPLPETGPGPGDQFRCLVTAAMLPLALDPSVKLEPAVATPEAPADTGCWPSVTAPGCGGTG